MRRQRGPQLLRLPDAADLFEIDPDEVKGRPVTRAVQGWLVSLGLGIVVAFGLHALDVTQSVRYVAIALTTTAIGTLLPILGDAGVLRTDLGRNVLASGAMGELGPIVAISVALTTDSPGRTAVVLGVFAAVTVAVGWIATREAKPRTVLLIARTLHSSGQLGVRICVLLCVLMVWTAAEFGLDVLLGAFAAGMVARLFLVEHTPDEALAAPHAFDHREEVQHRIEALGFGFFIPLFFVGFCLARAAAGHTPGGDEWILAAGLMAACNVGVTKTPIGSTLVVTEMAGMGVLPPTLIAAVVSMALTSRVGLIDTQRRRLDGSSSEEETDG